MPDFKLVQRLRTLCQSDATLLWLEGSHHERVLSLKLTGENLILKLANGTSRVVRFERYVITAVGLQFWSQGKPGVLFRWDQVSRNSWDEEEIRNRLKAQLTTEGSGPNDEPPPNLAA